MPEKDQMSAHLDNAMYGTPMLHPDEQRQYLGTFRERVSLLVTVQEIRDKQFQDALTQEISAHPDYQVIFNGHLEAAELAPYMGIASKAGTKFTIVSDDFYPHQPDSAGFVVVAKNAINVYPIEATKKYPDKPASNAKPQQSNSVLDKLKHRFGL
ncbi:hypothetical protein AYR62_03960 [Secundilactobacillus paracollinoides]|uniref:DUF1694 domain-containing protein n=1 Tax=Secundilactobacillus paracollinoides TaxID=240427 RepID=A0A1B2J061_9LACO|nr:YueI family protein [Secundilactobacillus paracollinoides]ANZ61702.1 hypothetical protein AYR61_10250 [Secundilactobacillus paracollinoides]ANZ63337.1 hypothetical protein AYR62_03960 [Secundilactobacillus paracollinoides]ANZ67620.1 hypothetical protein AYR63_10995 [Secundilactobacillus paracollinoides]KRL75981.1 hypothetical protein FC17_GL002292 [Secundilactobacillus paracollinoides DSM 15502 = JCM 11969]